ncbi:6-phosphofructokinase [uncultured Blautia sp.]|nr:6-phosphofructokinase [uncultured Blautia sp.]
MVAVSEGIHYADGSFVSEAKTSATDGFGHAQLGGLASLLAQVVKEKTGAKVRGIELSLLQRCGAHLASETDIEEAGLCAAPDPGRAQAAQGGLPAPLRQAEESPDKVSGSETAEQERDHPLWVISFSSAPCLSVDRVQEMKHFSAVISGEKRIFLAHADALRHPD